MERKKKQLEPKKGQVLYQKIGGGSLRIGGLIIKPGEKFLMDEGRLPEAFMDCVEELDAAGTASKPKKKVKKKLPPPPDVVYTLEPIEAEKGAKKDAEVMYNVIDVDEKVVNDDPLTKEAAEELIDTLK